MFRKETRIHHAKNRSRIWIEQRSSCSNCRMLRFIYLFFQIKPRFVQNLKTLFEENLLPREAKNQIIYLNNEADSFLLPALMHLYLISDQTAKSPSLLTIRGVSISHDILPEQFLYKLNIAASEKLFSMSG